MYRIDSLLVFENLYETLHVLPSPIIVYWLWQFFHLINKLYKAGKIFLLAKSPVAPNKTNVIDSNFSPPRDV